MILSKPNHIKIYGHRGARGDLPENTLESFKYLFENNINAYETDILISKDLVPVITHDFRLDPSLTKDNEGNWIEDENIKIFDLTYEELSKFDVGSVNKLSRYGRRFINQKKLENQRIPKLSELLEMSSKNKSEKLLINLEIKSTPEEENLTPEPEDTVKLVMNDINESFLKDKIIVSSFEFELHQYILYVHNREEQQHVLHKNQLFFHHHLLSIRIHILQPQKLVTANMLV